MNTEAPADAFRTAALALLEAVEEHEEATTHDATYHAWRDMLAAARALRQVVGEGVINERHE